jgi:hypothetical protein
MSSQEESVDGVGYVLEEVEGSVVGYILGVADGALSIGARIKKVNSEDGDSTPDGTEGTVISSLSAPPVEGYEDVKFFYFVRWDTHPGLPVGVMDRKIAPV